MAILLMRKIGRPAESSANGIRDPKGNPECLRASVDRVATGTSDKRVRTRSAWVGSGSCGNAGPVDACWRVAGSVGDIAFSLLLSISKHHHETSGHVSLLMTMKECFFQGYPLETQPRWYFWRGRVRRPCSNLASRSCRLPGALRRYGGADVSGDRQR